MGYLHGQGAGARRAKPIQNAFIESFNGPRDELLNETLPPSLGQTGAKLAPSRANYNVSCPHSRLGWLKPVEYADTFNPRGDLPLRSMQGSAPAPVACLSQICQTNRPSLRNDG